MHITLSSTRWYQDEWVTGPSYLTQQESPRSSDQFVSFTDFLARSSGFVMSRIWSAQRCMVRAKEGGGEASYELAMS